MSRRVTVIASVALLAGQVLAAAPVGAAAFEDPDGARCSAPRFDASVTPDARFQDMFGTYGDDNARTDDWTGADTTHSVRLPDGRTIWIFSDTFLGTVNPDHSRPTNSPLINNDLVVQRGRQLVRTVHGGTPAVPTSLVTPSDGSTWYWMGDGTVESDYLQIFLPKFTKFGPGAWDFEWSGTDVGSFRLDNLAVADVTPVTWENGVTYGAAVLEDGDFTYVYGVEDTRFHSYLHVARAARGDLLGSWEYFSDSGWSGDPMASARLLDGVANELSVTRIGTAYVLLMHNAAVPFGPEIVLHTACSPSGPWGERTHVYTTPEDGSLYTYGAKVHPEFTSAAGLLVSYNVNSFSFWDLYDDVDNYRPRFIRVQLTAGR